MPGGGGGDTTTVQKSDPWPGQQPYLKDLYAQYQNLFQNTAPQYFPESTVAGLSPYIETGVGSLATFGNSPYYQQGALASRNSMQNFSNLQNPFTNPMLGMGYGQLGNVNQYLNNTMSGNNALRQKDAQAGGVLSNYQQMVGQMTQNPQLDAMVNAAQTRTAQNFNEQVMPQISTNALGNNAYGGSRQGIAEGLAADRLQQQMGDIATGMYGQAYESGQNRALQGGSAQAGLNTNVSLANSQQGLQAQLLNQQLRQWAVGQGMNSLQSGLGTSLDAARLQQATLPSYAQYGMLPTQNLLQAGQIDQNYRQQLLDDEVARWNFYNNLPQQQLQQYASGIYGSGNPGGTQSTTGPGSSTSPLVGALGGAVTGAGIAGAANLFGTAGAAASPWLWPVIAGSALFGGLGNR